MRVLHVIDSGGLYGAERVVLALMGALREDGIECALASIAEENLPEKALEAEARALGFAVRRHTMGAGPDFRRARELVEWAKDEGFDLLHTHGYKANTLVAGMRRKQRRLRAVATLHGWTATRYFSRMRAYETAERFMLRNADRVVAVSEALVERWALRRRYGDRLRVIHNGIPVDSGHMADECAPLPREIAEFIHGRKAIFAAGRLSPEKGFDVLIEALPILKSKGLDVRLVLVGEGKQRARLAEQARALEVGDAVMMPGYHENAGRLMRYFDAIAIPSRSEGLPIVLLEALMAKVPIVATAVGEMPAVLRRCGARPAIDVGHATALTNELERVLNGVYDSAALEQISNRATELYSAQAMGARYRDLYEEHGAAR
jgi:glycosyltransferase involved in cell wall biosynthesis